MCGSKIDFGCNRLRWDQGFIKQPELKNNRRLQKRICDMAPKKNVSCLEAPCC